MIKYLRQFYYFQKNLKYRFYKKGKNKIRNNSLILVTHDFERQGAEVLLLHMSQYYFKKGIPLIIISRKYGVMIKEFSNYGYVEVLNSRKSVDRFLYKLSSYKMRGAILNTVVNGDLVEIFNKHQLKSISTVHELNGTILRSGFLNHAKEIGEKAKTIVFPSEFVRNNFLKITNINTSNSFTIHQGLFLTEGFKIDKKKSRDILEKLHPKLHGCSLIVLNVATAGYRKGIDIFIDLAIKSYMNNENIMYIWIGDKTAKHVFAKKKEYGLDSIPNLICPGYIKDINLINDYYSGVDIFCLTSREEPFGSVVLEAMNAYQPVIAFADSGGYLDVVIDEKTGLLAKKEDIDDMYRKILILKDEKLREKYGINGNMKSKEITFNKYCETFLEILNS